MSTDDMGIQGALPAPGRFWIVKQIWPYLRYVLLAFLPCPDLIRRVRVRRAASRLVTLKTWPGMQATSVETAQLAMMRLLSLQRQTRRAVRGRHREAAAMLARASVETLLLGLYCLRVPGAVAQLHAGNIKALGDGLTYIEELGIAPATIIRDCVARLGEPSRRYLSVWDMVEGIDEANSNTSARSIYRMLYVPLSNYTVHANGGTLLRHVRGDGRLRWRPSRSWTRRSPARVADAAVGLLAADLAQPTQISDQWLLAYARSHIDRALMPMAAMAFTGMGGSVGARQFREIFRVAKEVYVYLWTGPALADSIDARTIYVRERFGSILHLEDSDIPEDSLDPFIEYVADKFARAVPEANTSGDDERGQE